MRGGGVSAGMNAPLRSVLPPAVPSNDEAPPDSGRVDTKLAVDVHCDSDAVRVTLTDPRIETRDIFSSLTPSQRTSLALDGWSIGMRAVQTAYRRAEEAHLGDIGQQLTKEIEERMGAHFAQHHAAFTEHLRRYFDPRDGQVTQRLESFLKEDGELSRSLGVYLAPESGALARTLAREIGATSPLLRKLSATDQEGVVCLIQRQMEALLLQNQAKMERALDPLVKDSPVARLFAELRREVAGAEKDQAEKLARITKALDANDKDSLVSKLDAESRKAYAILVDAMNADRPGSALATLRTSISSLLDGHFKRHMEALQASEERQRKTEQSVQEAVARLTAQRAAHEKSPRGGIEFEDALERVTTSTLQGGPYIVERVGSRKGAQSNSKVGDLVVAFEPSSPYAGSKLVIEAKRVESYGVKKALDELEAARRNRGASVGLFVFEWSHAPAGFSGIRRYGADILVAWDPEDETTNPYLEAALCLGLALAARTQRNGDEEDIRALADIESKILLEIRRHADARKCVERIQKEVEELGRLLDTSDKQLNVLLKNAKKTLKALDVELEDAETARKHPVELPTNARTKQAP